MAITLDNISAPSLPTTSTNYITDKTTLSKPTPTTTETQTDETTEKVKKALSDSVVRDNLTKLGVSTLVTAATGDDFKIDPETLTAVKNGLINNTVNLLKSNALPLPVKNKLKRAIDKVCNTSSGNSFIDALKHLFEGLSLSEILKILACLSNPVNLAKIITAMAEDEVNNKYVGKALKYVTQTKDLSAETILNTLKGEARVAALNTTRGIGKSIINATKPAALKSLKNTDKVSAISNVLKVASNTTVSEIDKTKTSYLAAVGIKSAGKDDPKPTSLMIASGGSIENDFDLPRIKTTTAKLDKPSLPDLTLSSFQYLT